jgi:hypothetical protein
LGDLGKPNRVKNLSFAYLVVDSRPNDGIGGSTGDGGPDRKRKLPLKRNIEELQDLSAFGVIG